MGTGMRWNYKISLFNLDGEGDGNGLRLSIRHHILQIISTPPQQNQIKNIGPIRDIENLPVLFFRLPYKIKVKNSGSFLSKRNTFF